MTKEKVKRLKTARKKLDLAWYTYLDCKKKNHGLIQYVFLERADRFAGDIMKLTN